MAEVAPLTLAKICLDVQIGICMFLHPTDILALRKTCKALQFSTRKRVVWVAALHRVCIDNTLFLPSFPISDMSDLELERSAIAPHRWIELCGAFEKQHLNDPGTTLRPRATRIIDNSLFTEVDIGLLNIHLSDFLLVPGGRYLVNSSHAGISVLDLGYTSSADCKLIASVGLEGEIGDETCIVQATPDGMGLIIFWSNAGENCSIYEIYPESETPHLTKIAHLNFAPTKDSLTRLLPGSVIWFTFYEDRIVFRVWDYRLNHSISFSFDVVVDRFRHEVKVMATKTAVIVLCEEAVLIWAIPPLLPQPPDFFDHNPTHISPLFTIPYPDDIILHSELIQWNTLSSWYFGSSQPLYFDMLCEDSRLHRFKIMLKPDLSTASLHVTNTTELSHDFNDVYFPEYRICEDALVSCWTSDEFTNWDLFQSGVYTGLTSTRFANIISPGGPVAKMLFLPDSEDGYHCHSCPASGRFILVDHSNSVAVLDFF